MSKISRTREKQFKSVGNHQDFLKRIRKTLYYGKLPATECLSLPVTELAAELFSEPRTGKSLERLHCHDAAKISRNACVSPCSLVLALLYLERLKKCNPDYVQRVAPSELFLISLMVSSKFLQDDGGDDEVFMDEWASSGGISVKDLVALERNFLHAMDWEVFVKEETFWQKLCEMEATVARKEGGQRGWFTYTELEKLLATINAKNLLQALTTIVSVLTVTYTAGILAILSSMFIVSNIPGTCLQRKPDTTDSPIKTCYNHPSDCLQRRTETCLNDSVITKTEEMIIDNPRFNSTTRLGAADMFKTTLILASIQTKEDPESWDWWSKDAMVWLSESAKAIEAPPIKLALESHPMYTTDAIVANEKVLELQDQVHKATKVRIQDQMERSWHTEWTDSLRTIFRQKVFA